MLVDANILLYAADSSSPFHDRASSWLTGVLNGPRRVGFPWQCLVAFMRIATNARATARPLAPDEASNFVRDWLQPEVSWVPQPGPGHASIFMNLVSRYQLSGKIISDAHLGALAIEHGLTMCSADTDFAQFSELRWFNPVSPPKENHGASR